jgi:hypothetical protein
MVVKEKNKGIARGEKAGEKRWEARIAAAELKITAFSFLSFWYLEREEGSLLSIFKLAYKVFTTGSLFGSNPLVYLC